MTRSAGKQNCLCRRAAQAKDGDGKEQLGFALESRAGDASVPIGPALGNVAQRNRAI
ncbi:MAG TPA: hypothetical protein VNK95_00150 [Caldilineaceae bacterium]|nr:hypothetical protein [Caldilineaceae bacterium]